MEKGADVQTLSTEMFLNCGDFWNMDDYLHVLWNKTL